MEVRLNGETVNTHCLTLLELIEEAAVETRALVVEHNLQVVRQESWSDLQIQDGDTIELLSFVGGG